MFRNIIYIIIFLQLIVTGRVLSQATVSSEAFAEVVEALAAQETEQLNFGRFSPEISGGQIIITPDGIRSSQGTVVLASGTYNPGRFIITGAPLANFIIQLPVGPAELVHQSTNKTMTVDNWTSNPPSSSEASTQPDGSQQVSIGATLNVGNLQDNPVGIYTGTFQVTFAYN